MSSRVVPLETDSESLSQNRLTQVRPSDAKHADQDAAAFDYEASTLKAMAIAESQSVESLADFATEPMLKVVTEMFGLGIGQERLVKYAKALDDECILPAHVARLTDDQLQGLGVALGHIILYHERIRK
jgi:hypothetical protein